MSVESQISVGGSGGSGGGGGNPVTTTTTVGSKSVHTQESAQGTDDRLIVVHTLSDDGAGGFIGDLGSVDYGGKTAQLRVVRFNRSTESYKADHENAADFNLAVSTGAGASSGSNTKGGSYGTASVGEEMLAQSSVKAVYVTGAVAPISMSITYTPGEVMLDLTPYTSDRIVPGSVQFAWMGTVYVDGGDGVLYRGRTGASPGINSGRIDYSRGVAMMTDYVVGGTGPTDFVLQSLWTQKSAWRTASIFAQTQASPIQPGPGSFSLLLIDVAGESITATVDVDGNVTGPHVTGKLEFEFGELQVQFGDYVLDSALSAADKAEWWYDAGEVGEVQPGKIWRPWPVDPTSLRMAYTSYDYLPLDESVIRMPATTLPPDGRVPKFRVGDYVSVDDAQTIGAATYVNGDTITTGRTRLSVIRLAGPDGAPVTTGYTADLDAGTVQVTDTTGWPALVVVEHWLSRLARVAEVRLDGRLRLNRPLAHVFPIGSTVSSVLMAGDKRARVQRVFDQATWDGVTWSDTRVGSAAPYRYNDTDFPIVVTNRGALTERFAIRFRSNGIDFDCTGEHLGYVATGSKNVDFAPINPRTGVPYFHLPAGGWGAANWTAGNVVFVHTVGAIASFALVRAVQPSEAPVALDYSFEVQCRYDIDRPPGAETP